MHWTKQLLGKNRHVWAFAALAAASQLAAAQQAPPAPGARYVVVLDAAHGGSDPGGRLTGQLEKAYTLALSVRLRSLLAARGMQVVTTRESDETVDLNQRAEVANHANPQACISLHASQSGSGVHLYVSSLTPAERARISAWKTAQAAWVTRSLSLAGVLNSALLHAGVTVTLGRTSLPAVDSMACPAVAIEVAPAAASNGASGHTEAAALDDPGYQARVAEALAAGLLEWRADAGRSEVGQP
jgi:N-acetylmuramoyl-L-alanine amidase